MNALRIETVNIVAAGVGRIPAPWNFAKSDIDEHFIEISDQMMAMIYRYADPVEFLPEPG